MLRLVGFFLPLACALSAASAQGLVLDFESLSVPTADIPTYAEHLEDGMHLTVVDNTPQTGPTGIIVVGESHPHFFGSTAVMPSSHDALELEPYGGGGFDVVGLSLVEHFPREAADPTLMRSMTFTGQKPGGATVSQTFSVDESPGFESFLFSNAFQGIEKLTWSTADPETWWNKAVRVDDILIENVIVPEPATSALALAALGLPFRRVRDGMRQDTARACRP